MTQASQANFAAVQEPGVLDRIGFWLLLAFLFIVHSRVLDFVGVPLHIPAIVGGLALVAAVAAGRLFRAFSHPIGKALIALTLWIALSTPFSVWRSGSIETLKNWLRSLLIFAMMTAFILTYRQLRMAVSVIAISVLLLALLMFLRGTDAGGRLSAGGNKFGNPNDLALVVLIALPMWWFIASRRTLKTFWKVLAFACTAPMLAAFAKTGSRAGLVGFAAVAALLFITGSARRRLVLGFGALAVAGISFALLPEVARQRYLTLFEEQETVAETEDEEHMQAAATGSARARWGLLKDSLTLTLENPVLGVGPGQFMVAQQDLADKRGDPRGAWRLTHNSYTELSSESGIPALIFFLIAMWGCLRAFRGAVKAGRRSPEMAEVGSLGAYLTVSLVAFAVPALFISVAYDFQFPVIAGLAAALSLATRRAPAYVPAAERREVKLKPATRPSRQPRPKYSEVPR